MPRCAGAPPASLVALSGQVVMLSNLARDMDEAAVCALLQSVGVSPRCVEVMYDAHGSSQGCGCVLFNTRNDALSALVHLRNEPLRMSVVHVVLLRGEPHHAQRSTSTVRAPLVVRHTCGRLALFSQLDTGRDAASVRAHFEASGFVAPTIVLSHDKAGTSRGSGALLFDNAEDAERALGHACSSQMRMSVVHQVLIVSGQKPPRGGTRPPKRAL